MHLPLHYALEAHATAATLYIQGVLAPEAAVRAFRACYMLPPTVRRLLVDLRRAYVPDAAALETLEILLGRWRAGHGSAAMLT